MVDNLVHQEAVVDSVKSFGEVCYDDFCQGTFRYCCWDFFSEFK